MRKRIKDVVSIRNIKSEETNLPYIALENIKSWDATFVETNAISEGVCNVFKKDDILFGKLRPYLAKGFIPEYDGICSSEFLVLKANDGMNNKYLLYTFLSHSLIDYISNQVAGVKMPRTNWDSFSGISIEVPDCNKQEKIVKYLDAQSVIYGHQISLLTKKRDCYLRLKTSIINRAVTRGLNPDVSFKDSGIEWIGKIPEHWKTLRLKGIIQLLKGKTPSDFTFEESGLPYLNMDLLRNREDKPILYPIDVQGLVEIDEKEILVLWDGANAGEFILSKKGYLGSTMALFKIDKTLYDKRYFFALLKSIEGVSKYYANGTTIPHFDSSILFNYNYPLPPLSEQRHIASYLVDKCSKIDSAIANIDKQIDALKRLKRALINEVVTGKREV